MASLLDQAIKHQRAGRLRDAEALCTQILETAPDNSTALHLLGIVWLQTGRLPDAVDLISRAVRLDPDNPELHFHLGLVAEQQHRLSDAAEHYRRAISLAPHYGLAHSHLASVTLPGPYYLDVLAAFHSYLKPGTYVEIGVDEGKSLTLARAPTVCIGIDPAPNLKCQPRAPTKIFEETSDAFFASHDLSEEMEGQPVRMAFIDGMHLFEKALRDFINIERYAAGDSVILIHDCLPLDKTTSTRNRTTSFWSGDTWKIIPCLKHYRPDLSIFTIATAPTGLAVITHLDPESDVLGHNLDDALIKYLPLEYDYLEPNKETLLNVVPNDWEVISRHLETTGKDPTER